MWPSFSLLALLRDPWLLVVPARDTVYSEQMSLSTSATKRTHMTMTVTPAKVTVATSQSYR